MRFQPTHQASAEGDGDKHGGRLRNGEGDPDEGDVPREGQKPGHRHENEELAAAVDEKGVAAAAKGLEGGGENEGAGPHGHGNGTDAYGGHAQGHHVLRGVEKAQQRAREEDIQQHHAEGDADAHLQGQAHGGLHPVHPLCAVVVGENGDAAVVHAEDGHEAEALQLQPNAEEGSSCSTHGKKNLIDAVGHGRGEPHSQHGRYAYGVNAL